MVEYHSFVPPAPLPGKVIEYNASADFRFSGGGSRVFATALLGTKPRDGLDSAIPVSGDVARMDVFHFPGNNRHTGGTLFCSVVADFLTPSEGTKETLQSMGLSPYCDITGAEALRRPMSSEILDELIPIAQYWFNRMDYKPGCCWRPDMFLEEYIRACGQHVKQELAKTNCLQLRNNHPELGDAVMAAGCIFVNPEVIEVGVTASRADVCAEVRGEGIQTQWAPPADINQRWERKNPKLSAADPYAKLKGYPIYGTLLNPIKLSGSAMWWKRSRLTELSFSGITDGMYRSKRKVGTPYKDWHGANRVFRMGSVAWPDHVKELHGVTLGDDCCIFSLTVK